MAYTAVIFDLDGTLLDTIGDLAASGNHVLHQLGLPPHQPEEYKAMVGYGIPNLVGRMLPPDVPEETGRQALALFRQHYEAHANDSTAPYPGIPQLLEKLRKAGLLMAISSNKANPYVQQLVAHHFPGVFSAVLGKRDDLPAKPDAASVHYLIERLGAAPASTLYVGDSETDVMAARNAGIDCCAVLWGFRSRAALEQAGAHCFAANTAELEAAILG